MMTAEEARKIAVEAVSTRIDKDIKRAEEAIAKAAKVGDFQVDMYILLPIVQEKLIRLGYKVENRIDSDDEKYTRIWWG